MFAQPFWILSL